MLDEKAKAAKRLHDIQVMREYKAKERRRTLMLWGLLFLVLFGIAGGVLYSIRKNGLGSSDLKMPFIEKRHLQKEESHADTP